MTTTSKISGLYDLKTGRVETAHVIGTDGQGRRLFQFVEGFQPTASDGRQIYPEQDADGNWIEGTECEPYEFA